MFYMKSTFFNYFVMSATFQLVAKNKRPGYEHLIVNQEDESDANIKDFVDNIIFGSKVSVSHFL